jgi:dTDP-4-dehydrorhamnose reductase
MKVLVLGDGLLGSELVKQTGWDFISRKKDKLDVLESNLSNFFSRLEGYDVIVNCIANTDTYSEDFDLHWSLNCKFLDKLIDYVNQNNMKLVHISTDYIYANSVTSASELDVPIHLNTWYGYTKLVGDA